MPQQIDPTTGRPIGYGGGDLDGGQGPETIAGLPGLTAARRVGDDYQLKPFEYFRNEGGFRYAQNALTNPNEGQPPPPVDSLQPAGAQPLSQQPQQNQGIGGVPPQFLSLLKMLGGGIGWDGGDPYGFGGYGQANNVPNVYGGGIGGYPQGPRQWASARPQRDIGSFFQPQQPQARPMGIGNPNPYTTTLSGGINRGGYSFRRGGRV